MWRKLLHVPEGMTETHVIELIQGISRMLAPKYTFGYFTQEDIEQEAFILGMECLPNYNSKYSLSTFLYHHINNRLKNFKRDNYSRPIKCPYCGPNETCEYCETKLLAIQQKKNLMEPIDIDNVRLDNEEHMSYSYYISDELDIKAFKSLIDECLPLELREDYLRIHDGVLIPKQKRERVEREIMSILEQHGQDSENWSLD
jgi:DNA-directed RNA polymerase specialized sigma24 family protein